MKFLNLHDLAIIVIVVIGTHMLMSPVYAAIDNATGGK